LTLGMAINSRKSLVVLFIECPRFESSRT
jgi:hypothetical protein